MKAIILAGGEGTRLHPLTYTIPKPLIKIGNLTLTEQVFNILKKVGVDEVFLGIGYMAEKIKDYFGDGTKFDLKIGYLIEEKPMGTAGPLILLKRNGQQINEDFITVNGDNLFNFDLAGWLRFHQNHGGIATIALKEIDDVSSRGVVKMEGDKIIDFVEKPKPEEAPSNLINSGYYIFSPEIFSYIAETKDFLMFEKDIFPQIAKDSQLYGFIGQGQWFDTGTYERYEQVKKEWQGI